MRHAPHLAGKTLGIDRRNGLMMGGDGGAGEIDQGDVDEALVRRRADRIAAMAGQPQGNGRAPAALCFRARHFFHQIEPDQVARQAGEGGPADFQRGCQRGTRQWPRLAQHLQDTTLVLVQGGK